MTHTEESLMALAKECSHKLANEANWHGLRLAIREVLAERDALKHDIDSFLAFESPVQQRAEKAEAALAAECEVNFQHQAEIARHMAENERLRKDAERYRWLRESWLDKASERAKQAEPVCEHKNQLWSINMKHGHCADCKAQLGEPRATQQQAEPVAWLHQDDAENALSFAGAGDDKVVLAKLKDAGVWLARFGAAPPAQQAEPVASMKRDLEKFMDVDNPDCGVNWFISRMRWHLDRAALARQAEPVRNPLRTNPVNAQQTAQKEEPL